MILGAPGVIAECLACPGNPALSNIKPPPPPSNGFIILAQLLFDLALLKIIIFDTRALYVNSQWDFVLF